MAIMKTTIVGPLSGSFGGLTASHNRGGQYLRQRSTPTNPNSTYQQAVRSAMSQLSARWSGLLTPAERTAWELYAENVPLPNKLGDPINVGGLGMYQRTNVLVMQTGTAGGVPIDDAPSLFNLGEYTLPTIAAVTAATSALSLNFTATDDWVGEDDASLLIYTSRPVNPGINYHKGPYRYAGSVDGDGTTPPSSPANVNLAFACVAGQKVFIRGRVIRADGRVSADFRDGAISG